MDHDPAARQCLLRTDPPDEMFPFSTGGSGFLLHIFGRTCFFTARHIFADSQRKIDQEQLRRIVVIRKWGEPKGRNLSFEHVFFPQIPPERGGDEVLNDMLLLICHRKPENETDDSLFGFNDDGMAITTIPAIGSRLRVYGFPNIAGTTPIDYDERVYRPNQVVLQATFTGVTGDGHKGIATITQATDAGGIPFPTAAPPDGMSGSLVLADDDDGLSWAGMLVESGNHTIRFILTSRLLGFAHQVWQEESEAGRW